jgi:hypothetical protein
VEEERERLEEKKRKLARTRARGGRSKLGIFLKNLM